MNAIVIEGWDSPVHPAANLFPMMSDEDIDALAKSIREQGLRQPIIITEDGQLLILRQQHLVRFHSRPFDCLKIAEAGL